MCCVYRKWEGKGIGMATLVNLALENRIDLPTYRIYGEEVCLILKAGPLLGEPMKATLAGFDAYIEQKNGGALSDEQALVLAYLMKSEEANRRQHYSILLTPDNNHFGELLKLEQAGLIQKHPRSTAIYQIYVADRVLMQADYRAELEALFGELLSTFDPTTRDCLSVMYRRGQFSRIKQVTAKMAAFAIWYSTEGRREDIRGFDRFYRKIRQTFKNMEEAGLIIRSEGPKRVGYRLNPDYRAPEMLAQ
jgi:DNA-binding MarR family transcriptional regulator